MDRQILHVDMDAFYTSVEELENPSLRGKPVIVGADPNGRGVVAGANYEARKFGVHSAQPIRTAKRLCPHAVFLRGNYRKYREHSECISRLFREMTPGVEMVSIDEAYLDMTGCERLHGSLLAAASRLILQIKQRTGLNCSVGASSSRVVSKIASDQAKPYGLLCIFPGHEAAFLGPLPVRRMPGVGKTVEPRLRAGGITTLADVQRSDPAELKRRFGNFGEWLYLRALGKDLWAGAGDDGPRSISHETTFGRDTSERDELERTLSFLAQQVASRLREHRLFARTIGLKLRYSSFLTLTRDTTLREPTHLDSVIFKTVLRLFESAFDSHMKVRLLGVRASKLEIAVFQPSLLDGEQNTKLKKVLDTADRMRERFGFSALQMARSLEPRQRNPGDS